jgi:hypothetical protein
MISGAARLTAHGSAAAVVVGATIGGGGGNDGGAVAGATDGTVGSGVLDAVESLEPQPATAIVAATTRTAHFTTGQPTANVTGRRTGARRGIASSTTRLPAR